MLALDTLEASINSVKPEKLVERAMRFDGETLLVRDIKGSVSKVSFDHAYIVGAGKAAAGMADASYSVLEDRIADSAINVPYGTKINNKNITITEAAHPLPDSSGIVGTKKILKVLKTARNNDLVLVLISGGASALMPLPVQGITLSAKQKITNKLLQSGASIHEMNVVRKHLSIVKGGQLLRFVNRSCKVISLIISDVIDDDLATIASGPTYPDASTFRDALKILKKYRLEKTLEAVSKHIEMGVRGEIKDTPKSHDPIFSKVRNMIIGNNTMACKIATNYLQEHGLRTIYLGSRFDGEARDYGKFLARLACDLAAEPFALIAGGETIVKLNKSRNGRGGRNQEAALAYAIELDAQEEIVAAFMGTDGIDGNSDAAGALVSPRGISILKKMQLQKYLDKHDSYDALKRMNSLIFTGYTGTNVNDIAIVIYA